MRSPGITDDAHEVCPDGIALPPLTEPHTASLSASIEAANGVITVLFSTEMVSERTYHGLTLD